MAILMGPTPLSFIYDLRSGESMPVLVTEERNYRQKFLAKSVKCSRLHTS